MCYGGCPLTPLARLNIKTVVDLLIELFDGFESQQAGEP